MLQSRSPAIVGMLFAIVSCPNVRAEVEPVPLAGTRPLAIAEPLDAVMVAGINRFAIRALDESRQQRDDLWNRDPVDEEGRRKSIEDRRVRLRTILGAVDERMAADGFDVVAKVGDEGIVARFTDPAVKVYAVRWPVLPGVHGEGLLLVPSRPPVARVIALPDADWTPEMFAGLAPGLGEHTPTAARLAAAGAEVLVPTLISRDDTFSGNPFVAYTNQPHREFIYRQAFELGRHVIGYEVEKIQSAVDQFELRNKRQNRPLPIGVVGVGEGGLLALYAAAVEPRVNAALVAGYFQDRTAIWKEPIYRNVWSLLTEYGDAEMAGLIAPRTLVIEACGVPEIGGPRAAHDGRRGGAAPGIIQSCKLESVRGEFERAKSRYAKAGAEAHVSMHVSGDGSGPSGSEPALAKFLAALTSQSVNLPPVAQLPAGHAAIDAADRQRRQVQELTDYTQRLLRLSRKVRDEFWAKADRSSAAGWQRSAEFYRNFVWEEMIGKLPAPTMPPNVRSRQLFDQPTFIGYEIVLDVYPDVIAAGILLLPKGLQGDEKRPVVVCQHGLEGVPRDTITKTGEAAKYYQGFAVDLVQRGFIVYSPQNPYRGEDRFRVIQRQSNPLQRSLFSYIIRQHERTLEWLATLPHVDRNRIGFYGLSYGGKTAVRVPPILHTWYALAICSADYNDWIRKISTTDDTYGYVFTGEYEMPEWNMGHTSSYAELASLMTPRPFMVERGHADGVAPDEWVAAEYAGVRRHYNQLGLGDRTEIEFFNGPHTIHGVGTYEFLHRHLGWPKPARDEAGTGSRP